MLLPRIAALVGVALVVGCSSKPEEKPAGPAKTAAAAATTAAPASAGKTGAVTAGRAPGAIKADRTAGQDGALTGDSADDGVVSLSIDGPVSAIALVTVDASGAIDRQHQWDTVVGDQRQPAGWGSGYAHGADTWQLGVEEGGKMLNGGNGSLAPIGEGSHKLTLYFGDATHLTSSNKVIVLVERPDHSVVKSNVFTM